MSNPKCGICKSKMVKNGTTSAGRQRWRCLSCGSSSVKRNDTRSRWLKVFVGWLLDKASQSELGMAARTFRDKTTAFWDLWPIIPVCDEIHHVVYMDGIWLTRKCIILIACTEDHVIGCHLAQSENSKDWACLMARIAAPDILVCDGGGGIEKTRRAAWPSTRVQRCTFHAFCQVKRCTTRPKTQAGVDLYAIARDLMRIASSQEAAEWMVRLHRWCSDYEGFLKERADDGRRFKHESPGRRSEVSSRSAMPERSSRTLKRISWPEAPFLPCPTR